MDKKRIGKYIINSLVCLALMNVLFYATGSEGISFPDTPFTLKSLVCAVLIFVAQYIGGCPFFHRKNLVSLFVMGWWYLYLLYKFFLMNSVNAPCDGTEIIAGMGGAASFIMGQFLCEKYAQKKIAFIFLDVVQFLFCLPPVLSLIHYSLYGTLITYEEAVALHNTNFRESYEWIITYMGPLYAFMTVLVLGGIFLLINKMRTFCLSHSVNEIDSRNDINYGESMEHDGGKKPPVLILSLALTLAVSILPWNMWLQTDFVAPYFKAVRYSMGLSQYYRNIEAKKDSIAISDAAPVTSSSHTIIMVIGESATRDKMKAFTPDYKYDDTPWLSQQLNNPNFIVFKNAYACQSLTQQVLESALTEKSAYNDKEFLDSVNIIDIAKKKGYKTYWITNLGYNNNESSFFNVASRADVLLNTGDDDDHSMLAELSKINPQENNLIILHGNGSHAAYKERYPKEKAVFAESDAAKAKEAEYANSIRYTDEFLQAIYDYGRAKLNLQVMLYFSDHGEHMRTGHTPNDQNFVKVRIPMFIYLGDEYLKNNKAKAEVLMGRKDTFFTNDMMYNTLSGIMNAESNFYIPHEDLTNPAYDFTADTLWTFGNTIKVSEDPAFK
ncbi:phosphoethanolamine transferase [Anaerovibrio sp. RM50]|uniref:phosphoethanolamine transferase n=1 Tax=Anaerovibrio sp. RM50 TaxID=1200557 RepID=UPI000684564E|nr:phosphoethanolamine transferase [Anaerovibrio sp. RM50]